MEKEGKATTEWKSLLMGMATTVAAAVVTVMPGLLEQADKQSLWYLVGSLLLTIAVYITGRNWVKTNARKADALVAAANGNGKPADPT